MNTKVKIITVFFLLSFQWVSMAQDQTIAVLNIDAVGIDLDAVSMGNLVRLEIEKTGKYKVLDKYDLAYLIKNEEMDISECYGKICQVDAGKILGADKMLTGRVEKFDDKVIIILRLIDVKSGTIERSNIMEYLDLPELQQMVRVSVNNIVGIENDMHTVNMLSNYEDPILTPKNKLRLNGPRMGLSYVGGEAGRILQDPKDKGGFDAYPVTSLIGYQYELSYLSAGDFQALFEFIGFVGGLDQSRFVPSLTIMNGVRSNKTGWELAFGPHFDVTKVASGYYDSNNNWKLESEYFPGLGDPEINPNDIEERFDSRGDYKISASWFWAFGKTFRSGYLNIPVNVYFSIEKNGYVIGTSFGFNVSKK